MRGGKIKVTEYKTHDGKTFKDIDRDGDDNPTHRYRGREQTSLRTRHTAPTPPAELTEEELHEKMVRERFR